MRQRLLTRLGRSPPQTPEGSQGEERAKPRHSAVTGHPWHALILGRPWMGKNSSGSACAQRARPRQACSAGSSLQVTCLSPPWPLRGHRAPDRSMNRVRLPPRRVIAYRISGGACVARAKGILCLPSIDFETEWIQAARYTIGLRSAGETFPAHVRGQLLLSR